MRVTVISDTVQEFLGVRYYLCGRYYQHCGQRLHRVVWQHFNGRIPRRAHIHHRDHDKHNNQPENLVCTRSEDHLAYHGRLRAGEAAADLAIHARPSAAQWHGSAAGKEWHRQHWEQDCKARFNQRAPAVCEQCNATFDGLDRTSTRFCSNACKSAWRRRQRIDDVERKCEGCGAVFFANRFKDGLFCSKVCYAATASGKYERPVADYRCHHCGCVFQAADARAIWCSNRCRRANDRRKAKA